MSLSNDGKAAEAAVETWMKARSNSDQGFAYHRLPDARAARGALAAQPADYYVVNRGHFCHLEVKSTDQLTKMHKSKVSQWGKLYLFHLAGAACYVIVYKSRTARWYILRNEDLFSDPSSVSFSLKGDSFTDLHEALASLFPKE